MASIEAGRTEFWQQIWWDVEFQNVVCLTQIDDTCSALTDLFSLVVGVPVAVLKLEVCFSGANNNERSRVQVDGSHLLRATDSAYGEVRNRREMCLPYYAVEAVLDSVVGRWLEYRNAEKSPAASLWPLVVGAKPSNVNQLLLARVQFLDAALPHIDVASRAEFEKARDIFLCALPSGLSKPLAESLRQRIRGANNGSFKDRMAAALATIPSIVREHHGLDDVMLRKLRNLRNALAHAGQFDGDLVEDAVITSARAQILAVAHVLICLWPECPLAE